MPTIVTTVPTITMPSTKNCAIYGQFIRKQSNKFVAIFTALGAAILNLQKAIVRSSLISGQNVPNPNNVYVKGKFGAVGSEVDLATYWETLTNTGIDGNPLYIYINANVDVTVDIEYWSLDVPAEGTNFGFLGASLLVTFVDPLISVGTASESTLTEQGVGEMSLEYRVNSQNAYDQLVNDLSRALGSLPSVCNLVDL